MGAELRVAHPAIIIQMHGRSVTKSSQAPRCRELSEDGGLTLVKLCDGFGIPDHLLQAPIAFDWRLIGADVSM